MAAVVLTSTVLTFVATFEDEEQFVTKWGAVVSVHLSTNPIVDENGNFRGALAMVIDITERKRLEEKILRQKVQQQKEITKATLQAQENEKSKPKGFIIACVRF